MKNLGNQNNINNTKVIPENIEKEKKIMKTFDITALLNRIEEFKKNVSIIVDKNPEPKKEAKLLPDGWVSCKYNDLLAELKYYPDGDAPEAHNVFFQINEPNFWYCSDKKVGFYDKDGKLVQVAKNAHERLCKSISKKWAFQRDWIPEYRYMADGTNEENEAEVGFKIFECLANGCDRTQIIKACYEHLDYVYRAKPDNHKTLEKEENCNDAERFMYATLFVGNTEMLPKLVSDVDGHEISLPTEESLEAFDENDMKKFEAAKKLFEKVRERHSEAKLEAWVAAQCYALGMNTKKAINFIYGDRANGVKKYHRCEVKYSKYAKDVYGWVLDELEAMNENELEDLESWLEIVDIRRDEEFNKYIDELLEDEEELCDDETGNISADAEVNETVEEPCFDINEKLAEISKILEALTRA